MLAIRSGNAAAARAYLRDADLQNLVSDITSAPGALSVAGHRTSVHLHSADGGAFGAESPWGFGQFVTRANTCAITCEELNPPARGASGASMAKTDADRTVSVAFSTIVDALAAGQTVSAAGFGAFLTKSRPVRQGRSPRTAESIAIVLSNVPSFKVQGPQDTLRG